MNKTQQELYRTLWTLWHRLTFLPYFYFNLLLFPPVHRSLLVQEAVHLLLFLLLDMKSFIFFLDSGRWKNIGRNSIYTTKQPRYLKSVLFQNYIKKIFKTFKSGIVVMVGWWETMECMVLILNSSYMGRIKLLHHGAPMRRPNISTPPPTTNQV